MKKSGYSIILVLLSLASLLFSCRREALPEPAIRGNIHGEEVGVRLLFDLDREEAGTPGAAAYVNIVDTKALDDPDDTTGPVKTAIKDFYVLQFSGTADSSRMIGSALHFDYAQFISDANPYGPNFVKLVSSSQDDAVFILANTCDSTMVFPYGMTIAELKSQVKDIKAQADLFGKGDPIGSGASFPEDRTYHIMLNAQVNETISAYKDLNFGLKRNIAKVKVIFNNETSSTDCPVTVRSLSLHNVPNTSRYFTNTESQPEYIPSSELIQTFNYPAVPYDPAGNTFYVPVNKRGTRDNTTPGSKGMNAPPSSTYLWVDAYYLSGAQRDTIPVIYSYYLGANLMDDYNLLANSVYSYTIDIKMKGDADFDYRVDDWGPVDFTKNTVERANCYILNPAPAYDRQFRIPIDRIRTFWGGEGMTETTGYEQYDPTISADELMSKTFDAYILWTDIKNLGDSLTIDMTKNTGDDAYFTATVKPGLKGNAVVAVTTTNGAGQEEIMWSWHLWITDYRPNEAERYLSPEKGRYIYPVTGGAVHRYAGDIWNTGIYKDKFIMDRNLGALDTTFVDPSSEGKGVLYYQFGRKDPLPGPRDSISVYKNKSAKTVSVFYPKPGLSEDLKYYAVGKSSGAFSDTSAVRYSVKYPLAFIKQGAGGWTYNNKYNPTVWNSWSWNIRWQDPNLQNDTDKSIFDPCPPGYKVPGDRAMWDNFNVYKDTTNPKPTTNINISNPPRNLPPFGTPTNPTMRGEKNQYGMHYYPGTEDVEKTIYYPVLGQLNSGAGTFYCSFYSYYWTCRTEMGNHYGSCFSFIGGGVYPSNGYYYGRAAGFSVRCVQE